MRRASGSWRHNCKANFTRIAQQITGHLVSVDFLIGSGAESEQTVEALPPGPALHPDYTFDNFVVGPSNRLAHASCVAVSQSLGTTYNPLFLYGNAGLGKTHLLHAVCHEIRHRSAGASIQLLSCEEFVNRFIRAIEQGNMAGFHSQFRTVDALVIDDVQFLREREQSQEEFFHTFNALYNNGRQIILSADSPPAEIPSLEDRLVSRFNWGLVARIDPPSYETRVAIVQKKAHLRGLQVGDEIAEYIARQVQANIRELEGALTTIYALATTDARADHARAGPAGPGRADQARDPAHHHHGHHRGGREALRRPPDRPAEQAAQPEHHGAPADLHVPGPQPDQTQPRGDRRPSRRPRPHDGDARLRQDRRGEARPIPRCRPCSPT